MRLVADIQQQFAKIAALPIGTAIPPGGDDIGAGLATDALHQPQPLSRWLTAVSASSQALRTGNIRRQAALAYNAPGGPAQACQAVIANHYPFAATGDQIPLDAFARVFAPGGLLDGFFNTLLKPYVDTTGKVWKPQSAAAPPAGAAATPAPAPPPSPVTAADIAQFQRAATIREAFFSTGQGRPSVPFELTPNPAETRSITLDLAGTTIETGKGPAHGAELTWPTDDPNPTASLSIDPAAAPLPFTETGPWAMFRLLAHGRLQPSSKPGRLTLTLPTGGAPVSYEIHLSNQTNPFAPSLFTDFRCPSVQ